VIERKENTNAGNHAQGGTEDLVSLYKTPAIGMKLNRSDVYSVEQRNFEGSERKPKIEYLHNDPIHKKIMKGVRVNYGDKIVSVHRLYNDIAFPPRTR
jgi:hypothetical protein